MNKYLRMNNDNFTNLCAIVLLMLTQNVFAAEDKLELETSIIRGNKELPQILYVVPWQDELKTKRTDEQRLQLHSLFGDLFEPVLPEDIQRSSKEDK